MLRLFSDDQTGSNQWYTTDVRRWYHAIDATQCEFFYYFSLQLSFFYEYLICLLLADDSDDNINLLAKYSSKNTVVLTRICLIQTNVLIDWPKWARAIFALPHLGYPIRLEGEFAIFFNRPQFIPESGTAIFFVSIFYLEQFFTLIISATNPTRTVPGPEHYCPAGGACDAFNARKWSFASTTATASRIRSGDDDGAIEWASKSLNE